MSQSEQPEASGPGKVRTWWHPILARMFDYTVGDVYKVDEEVSVGKMPLASTFCCFAARAGGFRNPGAGNFPCCYRS